ncbi:DUF1761 domain-containing protein [Geodermatophilus sp. CPCC 205506]|uniref:DUF1761 domain-containing protein n=1 Tax=Geodermatophilus sp. CPCC 205506 TaxID=2936596 RepID=UPI003EEAC6C5
MRQRETDLRRVGVASAAAVAASGAWYAAFGKELARLDDAYADPSTPAWVLPVELVRSGTVAAAVAALAARTGVTTTREAVTLGLTLWGAFPVVLLTGSVVHERVPWRQAAIHAGDWLVKLVLISAVAGRSGRRADWAAR